MQYSLFLSYLYGCELPDCIVASDVANIRYLPMGMLHHRLDAFPTQFQS